MMPAGPFGAMWQSAKGRVTAHIVAILGATALAGVAGWVAARALCTPVYRSTVHLAAQAGEFGGASNSSDRGPGDWLLSDTVLARTLLLLDDPASRQTWADSSRQATDRRIEAKRRVLASLAQRAVSLVEHDPDRVRRFRASIRLECLGQSGPGGTEVVSLLVDQPAASGRSGHLAARYAADALADMVLVADRERTDAALDAMRARLAEFRTGELERSERDLREFVARLPAPDDAAVLERWPVDGAANDSPTARDSDEMQRLDRESSDARARRAEIMKAMPETPRSATADAEPPGPAHPAAVPTRLAAENEAIRDLVQRIASLRGRQQTLESRYTPAHPEVRRGRAELAAAHAELAHELTDAANRLSERIAGLTTQRDRERTRREALSKLLPTYRRLDQDVALSRSQYDRMARASTESDVCGAASKSAAAALVRLDDASTPDPARPVWPRPLAWAAWAAALTLVLGAAIAGIIPQLAGRDVPVLRPAFVSRRSPGHVTRSAPAVTEDARVEWLVLGSISHHPQGLLHS